MSKYLLNAVLVAGSSFGLYCATLAISPMASAKFNMSQASGYNIATYNNITGSNGVAVESLGSSANNLALAQQFQSQLSIVQSAYENASARLAQAQTAQVNASKSKPVQYARDPVDLTSNVVTNPDRDSMSLGTELAAAQSAEVKATVDLAKVQADVRKFLVSVRAKTGRTVNSLNSLW